MYAIVTHGGAGAWASRDHEAALAGIERATRAAAELLAAGASALDAVCRAVVLLEDDPVFNAGTGSVLNAAGAVEMDAAVMVGDTLAAGGVAALAAVRNPVLVARAVMENTRHVLLAGEGALAFAREQGFAPHDPVTSRRRTEFEARRAKSLGTVGAVAVDARGVIAAATSTGGMAGKLPGRVGDSPIAGAGNYADDAAGASATGLGELVLRTLATRRVAERVAAGASPQAAVEAVLSQVAQLGGGLGLIALDRQGRLGLAHDTEAMPHGFQVEGDARPTIAMTRRD